MGTAGKRVELILKMTHVSIYGHVSIVTVMCAESADYLLGGGGTTWAVEAQQSVSTGRAPAGYLLQVWHDRYMYLACSRPIDELAARLQYHLYLIALLMGRSHHRRGPLPNSPDLRVLETGRL